MRAVVGVGGGIAAYKAAELVRVLQQRGHDVQVIMTHAARRFVQPLTFAALTGRKVITSLWAEHGAEDTLSSAVEHISVARENDVLVVAPATAGLLARFANGLAEDFLTTLYLAFRGRVVLVPSMNSDMWQHAATQANLNVLRSRGCSVVEPDDGWLACGTVGPGRFPEPARIVDQVESVMREELDFAGETVLVTAGPTQEPIDPVRYISNRSSGKMGYAIADAALRRGARVMLISGPVSLPVPAGVERISVRTAQEMRSAVLEHLEAATIVIKAAAVADYYVADVPQQKLKKTGRTFSLNLEPTPDILAETGTLKGDRLLVGFAAETENLLEEARRKLEAKGCDMVVANLVNREGTGFESDRNEVAILNRFGETVHAGPADKREIAGRILDQVAAMRQAMRTAGTTA